MMCGLLRPNSGEVWISGEKITHAGIRSNQQRVGICPQEIILWNKLTCYEQLVFMGRMYNVPGKTARDRAEMLLDRIGLRETRNKLASTLSGGMKRRLNVIMAIIHDPEIVVFHCFEQIGIGGGNHPDINGKDPGIPQAHDFLLLQDPEKLRLDIKGKRVDFIQK